MHSLLHPTLFVTTQAAPFPIVSSVVSASLHTPNGNPFNLPPFRISAAHGNARAQRNPYLRMIRGGSKDGALRELLSSHQKLRYRIPQRGLRTGSLIQRRKAVIAAVPRSHNRDLGHSASVTVDRLTACQSLPPRHESPRRSSGSAPVWLCRAPPWRRPRRAGP